jgi:rare lipoprotein A
MNQAGQAQDVSIMPLPEQTVLPSSEPVYTPSAPYEVARQLPPNAGIYVQAGAFSIEQNATQTATALQAVNPAGIQSATINGQHYYRVRLGPFNSLQEAGYALGSVQRSGYAEAKIVID